MAHEEKSPAGGVKPEGGSSEATTSTTEPASGDMAFELEAGEPTPLGDDGEAELVLEADNAGAQGPSETRSPDPGPTSEDEAPRRSHPEEPGAGSVEAAPTPSMTAEALASPPGTASLGSPEALDLWQLAWQEYLAARTLLLDNQGEAASLHLWRGWYLLRCLDAKEQGQALPENDLARVLSSEVRQRLLPTVKEARFEESFGHLAEVATRSPLQAARVPAPSWRARRLRSRLLSDQCLFLDHALRRAYNRLRMERWRRLWRPGRREVLAAVMGLMLLIVIGLLVWAAVNQGPAPEGFNQPPPPVPGPGPAGPGAPQPGAPPPATSPAPSLTAPSVPSPGGASSPSPGAGSPSPEVRLSALGQSKQEGSIWCDKGNVQFKQFMTIIVEPVSKATRMNLSVDGNDGYTFGFFLSGASVGSSRVDAVAGATGLRIHEVSVPEEAAQKGFDRIVVRAFGGDGAYALGHLKLVSP